MIINSANLELAFNGFKSVYNEAFGATETHYDKIVMQVPSAAESGTYGWIGQFPQLREWVGPRHLNNLSAHGFTIVNRTFETTVAVKRTNIEDDRLGIFKPMFAEMGTFARRHPEEMVFDLLRQGFATPGFNGASFFAADHIVKDANGAENEVRNIQTGSGPGWFLLDTSRAIRPIIWQERFPYEFQELTRSDDPHVFMHDQYLYGVRARVNAGFGLWQLAFGSKATLDMTNYAAARAAMMDFRSDGGRILGVKPTVMVVPPELEGAALQILNATHSANGETNFWQGTAQLIVTPDVKG